MSKTNWQDPGSGEIISPHISGLQEAVGKIEDAIGLKTVTETDVPLTEIYISDMDRYRIYQAPVGKRNWVASPAPVIKKNGVPITTGFIIDYGGGAIILSPPASGSDVFTADVTRINSEHSITPASIGAETPDGAQEKIDTHAALVSAHSATSAAVANRIIIRDANGRAKVAAPSAADDIARKDTVDNHATKVATFAEYGHIKFTVFPITVSKNDWYEAAPSFVNPVGFMGILPTDKPIVDIILDGTHSENMERMEAWANVYRVVTDNNTIAFYSLEKPEIDLPVQVMVVRV